MIAIYSKNGQVMGTSQNLRGIHDRNRKQRASTITVSPLNGGEAEFYIVWPDGSWASTNFASYAVCVDHANSRMFAAVEKIIHPRSILGAA